MAAKGVRGSLKKGKVSIVEGLARISKSDLSVELNSKEQEQFEKALREEERKDKVTFQFGEASVR
jgi:hypothetical protein